MNDSTGITCETSVSCPVGLPNLLLAMHKPETDFCHVFYLKKLSSSPLALITKSMGMCLCKVTSVSCLWPINHAIAMAFTTNSVNCTAIKPLLKFLMKLTSMIGAPAIWGQFYESDSFFHIINMRCVEMGQFITKIYCRLKKPTSRVLGVACIAISVACGWPKKLIIVMVKVLHRYPENFPLEKSPPTFSP